MPEPALVLIARAPQHGRVKTRLAAGIGADAALAVYRQLLAIAATTAAAWRGPVLLAADGDAAAWNGSGLERLPRRAQPAGGLGGRIAAALRWGLECAPHAIAIGTDCPGLRPAHLQHLAAALAAAPVAFGPAADGGYWGMAVGSAPAIPLVAADDLPWSQPGLLAASRQRLAAAGLASATGDTLADCDDADDLAAAVRDGFLAWPHTPAETPR
jgi:rSAM/selenodomain-associated transferase 1